MALLSSPLKQRVHSFLVSQGAAPGAQIGRNYDQIFALLQRRRSDDTFWLPLTDLLRELVNSVVGSREHQAAARPEARLLALWDVRELAQLLREALPQAPLANAEPTANATSPTWPRLTRGLSQNTLGLFLLLSLAATACDSPPSGETASGFNDAGQGGSTSASGGAGALGGTSASGGAGYSCAHDAGKPAATDAGHPLPANCCADTASELWKAIDDSTLTASAKQELFTCFANLNATWCDGLVQIFKSASATDVASYLSKLLACCSGEPSTFNGPFSDVQQQLLEGIVCGVPMYKGVRFPD